MLGAPLKLEETRTLELKEVKSANPVSAIANAADEYAVAFLNSEGGTILWGIQDSGRVVVGVALPSGDCDRLRQAIFAKLHGIQPEVDPTRFRLSEELYVYKYVSDLEPYPWDHPSTNIQLRAWTRLLFVNKMVQCFGCDISYEAGNHLFNNDIFLHEAVASRAIIRRHIWDPEAHALFPSESVLATATDTLPAVMAFLREHDLPSEPTNLGRKRGTA